MNKPQIIMPIVKVMTPESILGDFARALGFNGFVVKPSDIEAFYLLFHHHQGWHTLGHTINAAALALFDMAKRDKVVNLNK